MDDSDLARSRILSSVVASLCLSNGFGRAEASAIEMLSGMLNAFIGQLLTQVKLFAELQGRTEPNLHDVASGFIEIGIDLKSLMRYIRRVSYKQFLKIQAPSAASINQQPHILHTSKAKPHPVYISDNFPSFPDPYTYIVTKTKLNNEIEYQRVREILAQQKINIERSLIKFKIKNNLLKFDTKTLSVQNQENEELSFLLIKNEPQYYENYSHLADIESELN